MFGEALGAAREHHTRARAADAAAEAASRAARDAAEAAGAFDSAAAAELRRRLAATRAMAPLVDEFYREVMHCNVM